MGNAERAELERDVVVLSRLLARRRRHRGTGGDRGGWWSERVLDWAMADPALKTQLFRFVDVLPAAGGNGDVVRHLEEHLRAAGGHGHLARAVRLAGQLPMGTSTVAWAARRGVTGLGRRFIAEEDPRSAARTLRQIWGAGDAFTVDLL
ncbi:MAG TPA: hypothetical protein VKV36_09710, partial [Acidimicrobiales bacterium]|nr:hypothetical protein [Acidimicrobiales bacterium]